MGHKKKKEINKKPRRSERLAKKRNNCKHVTIPLYSLYGHQEQHARAIISAQLMQLRMLQQRQQQREYQLMRIKMFSMLLNQ